jgi:gluconolactonase
MTSSCAVDRRRFLSTAGAVLGASAFVRSAPAEDRSWGNERPQRYPDPDVVSLDKRFDRCRIGNTPIERLHTGMLWAEGPAWNAVGRYLVWSDIPSDVQLRRLDEDGHVSVFRHGSGNTNGNTFDFAGRQVSCEHDRRRVVRYEHSGAVSVLADTWKGKPLNAPNDVVVHPDGGIWFTDPGYGSMSDYEGTKGALEIKEAVYRIDGASGQLEMVSDELAKPNGLCFSPDYKKLYVVDSGGPAPKGIQVYDVIDQRRLGAGRRFCSMELDGKSGGSDGLRADAEGNIWAAAGWAGAGFDGVHVFAPEGQRIGQIRLPEICSNVCFGGPKRNRLFMTASQSLYAVYVATRGAHIA